MMASFEERIKDSGYQNWIKACMCLQYLKEGISGFIDNNFETFAQKLCHDIFGSDKVISCKSCHSSHIKYKKREGIIVDYTICCPTEISLKNTDKVCQRYVKEISKEHKHDDKINWKNSDIKKWQTSHWEIAKVFMSPGQTHEGHKGSDCAALMMVLETCKLFDKKVDAKFAKQVRKCRNKLFHSSTMTIEDKTLKDCDGSIKNLLNSIHKDEQNDEMKTAEDMIAKVMKPCFKLTPQQEADVLYSRLNDMEARMKSLAKENEDLRKKIKDLEIRHNALNEDVEEHGLELKEHDKKLQEHDEFLLNMPKFDEIRPHPSQLEESSNQIKQLENELEEVKRRITNIEEVCPGLQKRQVPLPTVPAQGTAENLGALQVCDKVEVCIDKGKLDVIQRICLNHEMLKTLGAIQAINDKDVSVQFVDGSIWHFDASSVKPIHRFKKGMPVQIHGDLDQVQKLQDGHGGWNPKMRKTVGKTGSVAEVDTRRKIIMVKFGDRSWAYNPVSCMPVQGTEKPAEATGKERDSSSSSEDSGDETDSSAKKTKPGAPKVVIEDREVMEAIKHLVEDGDLKKLFASSAKEESIFMQALKKNNIEKVKEILEKSPDLVNREEAGKTPLFIACIRGNVEIVELLLEKKANIDATDDDNYTPVHAAAYSGHAEVLKVLLRRGAKKDYKSNQGSTPLHLAIAKGFPECVKVLLDEGASLLLTDAVGDTPMHEAILQEKKQPDIAELVLRNPQCDYTRRNKQGFTVFHLAALRENKRAVEIILDRNPELVNTKLDEGYTALHIAATNDHIGIARILRSKGKADLEARDNNEETPLMHAVKTGHFQTAEYLLKEGCDVNAQNRYRDTALHIAILMGEQKSKLGAEAFKNSDLEMMKLLLENGASLAIGNANRRRPYELSQDDEVKNLLEAYRDKRKA